MQPGKPCRWLAEESGENQTKIESGRQFEIWTLFRIVFQTLQFPLFCHFFGMFWMISSILISQWGSATRRWSAYNWRSHFIQISWIKHQLRNEMPKKWKRKDLFLYNWISFSFSFFEAIKIFFPLLVLVKLISSQNATALIGAGCKITWILIRALINCKSSNENSKKWTLLKILPAISRTFLFAKLLRFSCILGRVNFTVGLCNHGAVFWVPIAEPYRSEIALKPRRNCHWNTLAVKKRNEWIHSAANDEN